MVEMTETAAIEHDLAKTRARMDHRLDELQDHLTPSGCSTMLLLISRAAMAPTSRKAY